MSLDITYPIIVIDDPISRLTRLTRAEQVFSDLMSFQGRHWTGSTADAFVHVRDLWDAVPWEEKTEYQRRCVEALYAAVRDADRRTNRMKEVQAAKSAEFFMRLPKRRFRRHGK